MLRRILALAVLAYLTADYCDPSVPGVFWLGTESFFVESTEARPAMPALPSPAMGATLPSRDALEPIPRRVIATAPAHLVRHAARSYIAASPSPAPESSDDH